MTTSVTSLLESTALSEGIAVPGSGTGDTGAGDSDVGSDEWVDICPIAAILPDTGVCALAGGRQIAVFHLREGEVYAVGNLDPFSNAAVLSRGIVGDARGVPKVASPVYKQSFDLRTGTCLDDIDIQIPVYGARVVDGIVQVNPQATPPGDDACPTLPSTGSRDPDGGGDLPCS